MPHPRPMSGNNTAATPNVPCRSPENESPIGPAASNQTESTASPASTTSTMPRVSRANGERIWTVGARCGVFFLEVVPGRFVARPFGAGRFEAERFLVPGRPEDATTNAATGKSSSP